MTKNIILECRNSVILLLDDLERQAKQKLYIIKGRIDSVSKSLISTQKEIFVLNNSILTLKKDIDRQIKNINNELQRLSCSDSKPIKLKQLADKYTQCSIQKLVTHSDISELVEHSIIQIKRLETSIDLLDPLAILSSIKQEIFRDLTKTENFSTNIQSEVKQSLSKLRVTSFQICGEVTDINQQHIWWQEYWVNLPQRFTKAFSPINLFELKFLHQFQSQCNYWKQELQETEIYIERYKDITASWIERLANPSEQNRHELRRIYLDNANVVGITCSQSAKRDFSEEFRYFDVVIIDEVSKCTPPELLIPALKANKLVLVGDHRQLPPMINDSTIEDIAEELGSTGQKLSYLKESLFKNLFESAPDSIKTMLNIQYRMHPSIMMAINQFYDRNLECGLKNPDRDRAHHLANLFLQEKHHVVWVKTPQTAEFKEQSAGTSFSNPQEVETIQKICQQFEHTWASEVARGQPRKEIGIITFYGEQLRLIKQEINPQEYPSLHIRTGTVDIFQGMEKQVIIVSMVRNNDRQNLGFAKSPERVNVAFSRAQELLVVVGCASLFAHAAVYSEILNVVRTHGDLIDVSDILN